MNDADEMLLSLAQPIAVVGNGTIRNRRDEIEAHATIIRFNDFRDVGYERHIGTRLHVWAVSCCGETLFRQYDESIEILSVATMSEQGRFIPRWAERYPWMSVPAESWIRPARQLKQRLTGMTNPTTGLVLLLRLMHHGIDFTAFGFDGLRSGHYWDVAHEHTPSHGDEFAVLMELARRGARFG